MKEQTEINEIKLISFELIVGSNKLNSFTAFYQFLSAYYNIPPEVFHGV